MVFCGYHSLMSEVLSRHPPAAFEGASSDIYSLKFLLQLRYLERQLATHCNIHKRDLHHIVVHGFIVWMLCGHLTKMLWLFQKARFIWMQADVDSQEKASFPCPVLPQQEPAEDIYRASPWSWTLIWMWPTYWKKNIYPKMVGTWESLNCGTLTEVQKRRLWWAKKELPLFCQQNVPMPWYWKRRSSTEK